MKGRTAGSDAMRWRAPIRPRGLRRLCAAVLALAVGVGLVARANAEDASFFRIATGSSDSPFFTIGGLLASAISKPPGSRACSAGGSCGVPGLIAVAVSTDGPMANVEMVNSDKLESGLMSSDTAYWAYRGEGPFQGRGKFRGLTAIASLYPEAIHLVVARKAKIHDVKGLAGKRVSLGPDRSGEAETAREILQVFGLAPTKAKLRYDAPKQAAELLKKGQLDAFFVTAAGRSDIVADLAASTDIEILPLSDQAAQTAIGRLPYLSVTRIPAGTYKGVGEIATLAVPTQWIVSDKAPEEVVYGITRALWHPTTRRLLDSRTPEGKQIKPGAALEGMGVPLHPGAARYYREARMLN